MSNALFLLFVSSLLFISSIKAQYRLVNGKIVEGDTLALIPLSPITVNAKRIWKSKRARIRYTKLQRDVRKAYPYAKRAGALLRQIDAELAAVEKGKQKREYVQQLEENLKAEFEGELRNMTISQGRILIKLIDRETKHTCYNLVKDLKGGVSAFFWQGVARVFGSSLKYEYDPEEEKEIENIIARIESGYYD